MAVVEFDIGDLEKLVGRKLSKQDLEENIPMIGCALEKLEGKKVFFELFPNRPDMLSVEGFSRAVATFLGSKKEQKKFLVKPSGLRLVVDKSVKPVRPHIACCALKNVKLTSELVASLMQLQEKLHDTFGRKRKKIAIGVHDMDKVKGPFIYKAVDPPSVKFIPLGMPESLTLAEILKKHPKGIAYAQILEKSSKWPVILDSENRVLSFPPIINGELTKVTGKTKNLFIEVTGTSSISVSHALNIVVASIYERGCDIETVEVLGEKKSVTPDLSPQKIKINLDYLNKLLDTDLTQDEFVQLLKKMGMDFDGKFVLVPPYRTDVMHEIDIVEDVAVAHGYRNFEPKIPKVPTIAVRLPLNEKSAHVKSILAGLGLQETISMVLTNKEDEFKKMLAPEQFVAEAANPVSSECSICRVSLLPSLLKTFLQNKHVDYPQGIFEIGDVVVLDKSDTGASNLRKLAVAISDHKTGYEDITPILDALLKSFGVNFSLKNSKHPSFIEGRAAEILVAGKPVGVIGEIHPQVLNNWNIEKPVVAFEIDLEEIFGR